MRRLSYIKVFSKYRMTITDSLARYSYITYKNIRIGLSRFFPLKEHERFNFEDHRINDDSSDEMPKGFNYLTHSIEDGYINLDYIDFYDYLP